MSNVIENLKKYNISARKYKKAPLGKHVFFLNTDADTPEKEILLHEGDAEVTVVGGDKKLQQAVLRVKEKKHKITKKQIKFSKPMKGKNLPVREFGVALPTGSKVKVIEVGKPINVPGTNGGYTRFPRILEATVPESLQTFLIGMDENTQFISALPRNNIKSVEEAHKVLKPRNLDESAKRQGEWFFEPVEEGMLSQSNIQKLWKRMGYRYLERGSFHKGNVASIKINGKMTMFAIGVIQDTRHGRHQPLLLNTWHKVKRNKERRVSIARRQRGWD